MSDRIEFELPLPPRELSPNARVHWSVKAAGVLVYRRDVAYQAAVAMQKHHGKPGTPARISFVFRTGGRDGGYGPRHYRPRDADNALGSMKAAIDGLVQSGMIPDDSAAHLEIGSIRVIREKPPGVTVTLEEVRGD